MKRPNTLLNVDIKILSYVEYLEYELQSLRDKLNDLRTWIIENTEDVEGQDGVKWNCIERDELLNYLKG